MTDVARRPHVEDSEDCWCGPLAFQLCPICMGERCDHCGQRGLVAEYDEDQASVIVHACDDCGSAEACDCTPAPDPEPGDYATQRAAIEEGRLWLLADDEDEDE